MGVLGGGELGEGVGVFGMGFGMFGGVVFRGLGFK